MRVSLQPSYILHRRPYRDSSMLLEVLTAEQGRISLIVVYHKPTINRMNIAQGFISIYP